METKGESACVIKTKYDKPIYAPSMEESDNLASVVTKNEAWTSSGYLGKKGEHKTSF